MKPVRVLTVDDSPTMRALVAATLQCDPDIRVVGEAADPFEARDAIKRLDPDVITLDIEMPRMNGLEFLEKLMRLRPTRTIIVSSLTEKGATATIRALETGAFDCVAKPSIKDPDSFRTLPAKVKAAAAASIRQLVARPADASLDAQRPPDQFRPDGRIVAMGSSTGGVEALLAILSKFPENCPPTVITQHMPGLFTSSFAKRLDRLCKPHVREATEGAPIAPGHVYIAPGGEAHLEIMKRDGYRCRLRQAPSVNGHRPSIDVLFRSVAQAAGPRAVGVILTGMGNDGADGMLAMRQAGADTIGQDEASSLIYGMPRAAHEAGAVRRQVPLHGIAESILNSTNVASASARQACP